MTHVRIYSIFKFFLDSFAISLSNNRSRKLKKGFSLLSHVLSARLRKNAMLLQISIIRIVVSDRHKRDALRFDACPFARKKGKIARCFVHVKRPCMRVFIPIYLARAFVDDSFQLRRRLSLSKADLAGDKTRRNTRGCAIRAS